MSDRLIDLAHRALAGERAELEALLTGCTGVVHAIARSRLGDSAAAETATVDALARIASGLPGLHDAQAFPGWLRMITMRCAQAAKGDTPKPTSDRADPDQEPADRSEHPVELLVAMERREQLRLAVAQLPPELQKLVALHFVEGMTFREMATLFDIGLGTVVRRMRRALQRLKHELGEQTGDET